MFKRFFWISAFLFFFVFSTKAFAAYEATSVLGQTLFTTQDELTTQSGMNEPRDIAYDSTTRYLFVADALNNRVLVFDISDGVTDGENAIYVLGQEDFTSSSSSTERDGLNGPSGLAVDEEGRRLFVSELLNDRIVVYDITTIENGEDAVSFLGVFNGGDVTDPVTGADPNDVLTQNGVNDPWSMYYDSENDYLFVGEASNYRVTVFDVASITDGENAIYVLGNNDFTTKETFADENLPSNLLGGAYDIQYDTERELLYVLDNLSNVAVFDLSDGITSAENLLYRISLTDPFLGFNGAYGFAYDPVRQIIHIQDFVQGLVSVDFSSISNSMSPFSLIGQTAWDGFDGFAGEATRTTLNFSYNGEYIESLDQLVVADGGNNRVLFFDFIDITEEATLTSGSIGEAYTNEISTDDVEGSVELSLVSGTLPPGLTLSEDDITGTPTAAGNYSFTLRATDVVIDGVQEQYSEKAFTMSISATSEGEENSSGGSSSYIYPDIKINNNDEITFNRNNYLTIRAAENVSDFYISNNPDFSNYKEYKYGDFYIPWDICWGLDDCRVGDHNVYGKFFFNGYEMANDVDDIFYKSCPYFTKWIRRGKINDGNEIQKIKEFLNEFEGENLVVNKTFDNDLEAAIHRFQKKYYNQIIDPWEKMERTSGYWYKTTSSWANFLYGCPTQTLFLEGIDKNFKHPDPITSLADTSGSESISRSLLTADLSRFIFELDATSIIAGLVGFVIIIIIFKVLINRKGKKAEWPRNY